MLQLLLADQVNLVEQDEVGKRNLVHRLVHHAVASVLQVLQRA